MSDGQRTEPAKLAAGIRAGNPEAFEHLYRQTVRLIYFHARSLSENDEAAWDLVQDTYTAAWKNIGQLREDGRVVSWLTAIALNLGHKRMARRREYLLDEGEEDRLETLPEEDESRLPEAAADRKETISLVREEIQKLPSLQKAAVIAYYVDQMAVGQTARAAGCSEGTIKSRLNYARRSIQAGILKKEREMGVTLHSLTAPLLVLALRGAFAELRVTPAQTALAWSGVAAGTGIAAGEGGVSAGTGAAVGESGASAGTGAAVGEGGASAGTGAAVGAGSAGSGASLGSAAAGKGAAAVTAAAGKAAAGTATAAAFSKATAVLAGVAVLGGASVAGVYVAGNAGNQAVSQEAVQTAQDGTGLPKGAGSAEGAQSDLEQGGSQPQAGADRLIPDPAEETVAVAGISREQEGAEAAFERNQEAHRAYGAFLGGSDQYTSFYLVDFNQDGVDEMMAYDGYEDVECIFAYVNGAVQEANRTRQYLPVLYNERDRLIYSGGYPGASDGEYYAYVASFDGSGVTILDEWGHAAAALMLEDDNVWERSGLMYPEPMAASYEEYAQAIEGYLAAEEGFADESRIQSCREQCLNEENYAEYQSAWEEMRAYDEKYSLSDTALWKVPGVFVPTGEYLWSLNQSGS